MALLNVACILAARGRRVLMIDFDLEAPGLTLLQSGMQADASASNQPGLVDLIQDFLTDPKASPLADKTDKTRFRDSYVRSLPIPEKLKRVEGGYLDLMPCGRLDAAYQERLYNIKFDKLYEEGVGEPLFRHFKNVISESGLYDYVFVDSRTGYSDEGSICTRDLADHLVLIMGLNHQNVKGTVSVLKQLKSDNWKAGRVICVASPVPLYYEELREKRMNEARLAILDTGFNVDFELGIPYHPRLALDEEPFIFDWSGTDLFSSYENLQRQIRALVQDTTDTWSARASEAISKGRFDDALRWFKELAVESPETAEFFLSFLFPQQITDNPALLKNAEPFFNLWLSISRDEILVRLRYAEVLALQKDYERALSEYSDALSLARSQHDDTRVIQVLSQSAGFYRRIYQNDKALQQYQEILNAQHQLNDRRGASVTLYYIGQVYNNLGQYDLALTNIEEALKIYEELGDRRGISVSKTSIGQAYQGLGQYDLALTHLEEALKIGEELGDRRGISVSKTSIGQVYNDLGQYDLALTNLEEALKIAEELGNRRGISAIKTSIGLVYNDLGQYDLALTNLEEALKINEELIDREGKALNLADIASIKVITGNIVEGIDLIEKAVLKAGDLNSKRIQARIRVNYVEILFQTNDSSAAMNYLNEYWVLIQQFASAYWRYNAYLLRAKIKSAQRDVSGSAEDIKIALAFYREQNIQAHQRKEAEELARSVLAEPTGS